MDDTEVLPKCLAGVRHTMPAPQRHIRGEAQSRLDYGLGVLHMSSPWVERHVHDHIGVVGSQWVWVRSCRHSHRERVQHWVVYSWEASHMVERNACSELAQNKGRPYFLTLCLPTLLYQRLKDLID